MKLRNLSSRDEQINGQPLPTEGRPEVTDLRPANLYPLESRRQSPFGTIEIYGQCGRATVMLPPTRKDTLLILDGDQACLANGRNDIVVVIDDKLVAATPETTRRFDKTGWGDDIFS